MSSYAYDLLRGGEQKGPVLLAGGEQRGKELLTGGEQTRPEPLSSALRAQRSKAA